MCQLTCPQQLTPLTSQHWVQITCLDQQVGACSSAQTDELTAGEQGRLAGLDGGFAWMSVCGH